MILIRLMVVLPILISAQGYAHELPELGDISQATLTPYQERQLGLQIMRQIRADPRYLDDAEIASYLSNLGHKLIANSNEASIDQTFEFFAVQDPSINAFALPGGFMGFNSGLIIAAQSESELAAVMSHEIAHVTQKHLARMIAEQKYDWVKSIASLAVAILAARSSAQASQAILVASQASIIQSKLDFTRKHEKEADRIGLNILLDAGFDPQGMPTFFERLQKAGRFHETGAPSYLRTHPLTFERIADIQNRTREMPYRQVPDSIDFLLVRAKLRALQGKSYEAVAQFKTRLEEKRYNNEAVERYGYIQALLRDKKAHQANAELNRLYQVLQSDPSASVLSDHVLGKPIRIEYKQLIAGAMMETLAADVLVANDKIAEAMKTYQHALKRYPQHRALIHGYGRTLIQNKKPQAALEFINKQLQLIQDDAQLFGLQAQCYELLGDKMLEHRAQAEVYFLKGHFGAAIDQLKTALQHGNGNFYQLSSIEARLKQLQTLKSDEEKAEK
ncbi:M48 family peptidase [Nitrosomonas sp. JL21]|nr:M48 family metalloprotease [Nitrosomonas sp. JL21]MBL8496237.1 M48 family metallopeptidase [Nitrosomonas sp.]MCC7090618.1 M48 family metallopeptidase [Nitrosomonas sp.]MXS76995.1 M48 family peptidase [Nitrosomonas sp. JL21]